MINKYKENDVLFINKLKLDNAIFLPLFTENLVGARSENKKVTVIGRHKHVQEYMLVKDEDGASIAVHQSELDERRMSKEEKD